MYTPVAGHRTTKGRAARVSSGKETMTFAVVDYIVLVLYLVAVVAVGLWVQKKASKSAESYFLGDNSIPWWALAASGMSSNLDVAGTMINTALVFTWGASGMYLEFRGGVTLVLAFLMVYVGKWNRRSGCMTAAEWMKFRFGEGRPSDLARVVSAAGVILQTVLMITYFSVGAGKFVSEFLSISEFLCALVMIVLAMAYTVTSGLFGVVYTDLFQSGLIFAAVIYVCVKSFVEVTIPDMVNVSVPLKNGSFSSFLIDRDEWVSVNIDPDMRVPSESVYSPFNAFLTAVMLFLMKTTIEGMGGPNGYAAQRYFAAKNDEECGLMSVLWIALLSFRWPFIMALAMLGLKYNAQHPHAPIVDPERVLPTVVNSMMPNGMRGLLVAGFAAAAMSTFDSTVNAASSYWVNDIYHAFINKSASNRRLIWQSRLSSVIIVAIGWIGSLIFANINDIWGWVNAGIAGGLLVPLFVRWYWWRMNGYGFSAGVISGLLWGVIQYFAFPDMAEYYQFLSTSIVSISSIIVGAFYWSQPSMPVLKEFYVRTRPWGFWGPVRAQLPPELLASIDRENRRDKLALLFSVPWQVTLFLLWMCVMTQTWGQVSLLMLIQFICMIGLYKFWYVPLSTLDRTRIADTEKMGYKVEGGSADAEKAENTEAKEADVSSKEKKSYATLDDEREQEELEDLDERPQYLDEVEMDEIVTLPRQR